MGPVVPATAGGNRIRMILLPVQGEGGGFVEAMRNQPLLPMRRNAVQFRFLNEKRGGWWFIVTTMDNKK